jgi:arginine-tRNA-protein transferase
MSEHQKQFPEFYVTAPQPCPYLKGRNERKLFTHLTHDKSPALVDSLLRGGFRRSQNVAYIPYCEGCQACVSVRVLADEFELGRSFRRILKANEDLIVRRTPALPTSEQFSLFRRYIDRRHGDGGMVDMNVLDYAMMVEDSIIETTITEYRLPPSRGAIDAAGRGPLIAVALCDRLGDGISMVYSFFDPDLEARSLGTFMILDAVRHVRDLGLAYLYLGYWIDGSRKMSYKERFAPREILTGNGWVRASQRPDARPA